MASQKKKQQKKRRLDGPVELKDQDVVVARPAVEPSSALLSAGYTALRDRRERQIDQAYDNAAARLVSAFYPNERNDKRLKKLIADESYRLRAAAQVVRRIQQIDESFERDTSGIGSIFDWHFDC